MAKSKAKNRVVQVLKSDRWTLVEGQSKVGPFLLRYRTPVLAPPHTKGYGHLLTVVWPYADENTGAMPTDRDLRRMGQFENRLCDGVEHDGFAILTAVLTFDGARQWVFYTGDASGCLERLTAMPQKKAPYPIELTTERDPGWKYLRKQILKLAAR